MKNFKKYEYLLVMFVIAAGSIECFIPAQVMDIFVEKLDSDSKLDFGQVSETYTHDDIIKYGVIRSIARYFGNLTAPAVNVSNKIDLTKLDSDYKQLRNVYGDYYGRPLCSVPVETLITRDLQPNVAVVDFDPKTKDLPTAHFDAEQFTLSNQRVMDFKARIYQALAAGDYQTSRELTGQVLHTIQDFYSHSNWVEMGNTDINKLIGTSEFSTLRIAAKSDNNTCFDNCTRVESKCGFFSSIFIKIVNALKKDNPPGLKCPLVYFKCSNNLAVLDRLESGYYSGQKFEDGTTIAKPPDMIKCGHGGFLDGDAFKAAAGGINKDSGIYLFSPHADLHLKAANLAIRHSELFFNEIRDKIGNDKFNEFLNLNVNITDSPNKYKCSSSMIKYNAPLILIAFAYLIASIYF